MSGFRDPFKASILYNDDENSSVNSDESDEPRAAFPGHRDTLALLHLKQHHASAVHTAIALPSELLQQIYQHLAPLDFHAARHVCKKWFLASLDKTLLQTMTRRAGCSQAASEDSKRLDICNELRRHSLERRRSIEHAGRHIIDCHSFETEASVSDEWLLSKRLATEARITPGRHMAEAFMALRDVFDFKTLLPHDLTSTLKLPAAERFTVSSCGRFLLVNCGQIIYVYALWPSIRPITSLRCRRQVLSVSMDTSSNRYSIAVLLERRMGICWDLGMDTVQSAESSTLSLGMEAEMYTSDRPDNSIARVDMPIRRAEQIEMPAYPLQHVHSTSLVAPEFLSTREPEVMPGYAPFESTGVPLEVSAEIGHTTAVYEQLGSPDDSPRSVAICPQRKCVAFGCRRGIELHWIDALTGGDLKRWFPLAAPSDFLYFLPQRPGIDSTKKLRLISSAGGPASNRNNRSSGPHPEQRSSTGEHSIDGNLRPTLQRLEPDDRRQSMTRLFFGTIPFPSTSIVRSSAQASATERQGVLRTVDCDHYRAIPLSDGIHVLFTDPCSGLLCLGSDAPLGGPTKLIRKFVFLPPGYVSTTTKLLPKCYSAAQDLQWGVRVVTAYADGSLVLFNIPSDCFNHVKQIRNTPDIWDEQAGLFAQSDLLMDIMMDIQRTSEETTLDNSDAEIHSQTHTHARPFRTIQVPGVRITNLEGTIDDIAVSRTPCYAYPRAKKVYSSSRRSFSKCRVWGCHLFHTASSDDLFTC